MKIALFTLAILLAAGPARLRADDLSVTLPNGKVVTFQSAEQKAKFEAALNRRSTSTNPVVGQEAQPQKTTPAPMGHTALDEQPTAVASVNIKVPQLTADYYLANPETWLGKRVALSVAYVESTSQPNTGSGLQSLLAYTYNVRPGSVDHHPMAGGKIIVLVKPEHAEQLTTLCGSKLRLQDDFVKTTLIHGEFRALENSGNASADPGVPNYGLYVDP